VNCPLCGANKSVLQRSLQSERIISSWMREYGIDVRSELGKVAVVEFYRCGDCALGFFEPNSIAGSPSLYEKLEKIQWYYLPRKWEHDVALRDMNGARNGIEIGCGFGHFVARVQAELRIPFEGCEQNYSAVKVARSNGLTLLLDDSANLAKRHPAAYDIVCSFQVLEHVSQPGTFLRSACELLRPGGKLLLGLPNGGSFLKHQFNLFDLPPHHMTRWTAEVLTRLQASFPLKLLRIAYEPLEDTQVDVFVNAYSDYLCNWSLGISTRPGVRSRLGRAIRHPRVRHFLRGQTFYASYLRT
jgi:SAM-dependent methyltransferase